MRRSPYLIQVVIDSFMLHAHGNALNIQLQVADKNRNKLAFVCNTVHIGRHVTYVKYPGFSHSTFLLNKRVLTIDFRLIIDHRVT